MINSKWKLTACALLIAQVGIAQETAAKFSESDVKAAVEELAFIDICPNPALREVAEIEATDCKSHLSKLAPVCWHILDQIAPNYEIDEDGKTSETVKDRLVKIAVVYSSCIRGEILRQIVKTRRESSLR